jgi:hypothetical protein
MAQLEEVWLAHSAHKSSSIHLVPCIGPLDLSIALWMHNRCIADLDAEVFTVPLKHPNGELGLVVSGDHVQDPKPADD